MEQLGQWNAKERERVVTVEEFEEKMRTIDEFKKWAELEDIFLEAEIKRVMTKRMG